MRKWTFIIGIVVVITVLLTSSAIAKEEIEGVSTSHMMGEMGDETMGDEENEMMEPYMKGHEMKGYMMGKHMSKHGMPVMHLWEDLKEKLNLTEEQAKKFKKIYTDYRREVLRKRVEVEIAEMDFEELLKGKAPSEKAIEEGINKLQALKSNLTFVRIKSLLKTRDFLSDEQYEELTGFILGWNRPHRMGWWGMPWGYGRGE